MQTEIVQSEVLCIGGGIAGLMAAIRAAEMGASVVVVDKSNTLRSGMGGAGNDHFLCYIPEAHGPDMSELIESVRLGQLAEGVRDPKRAKAWFSKSFDIVRLWDEWGIPMKYQGRWEFSGHSFPGRLNGWLRYEGLNQKRVLTKEALKRGVRIVNRVMVFDLLGTTGSVTGALGSSTREDKLIEFKAKSVVLGTGGLSRLFPGPTFTPAGNTAGQFSSTGDGRAMAYRLGAELVRAEGTAGGHLAGGHVGMKYYSTAGQGSWIGVYRDAGGKAVGKFVTRADRRYSDMTAEAAVNALAQVNASGRGPLYMDLTDASEADVKYMKHWLANEGNLSVLKHIEDEGIDLRKHQLEFEAVLGIQAGGSIMTNEKAETAVKGLYAAGNEVVGSISNAAVFGWYAGENAAQYAKTSAAAGEDTEKVTGWEALIRGIKSRKDGPDWKEANVALNRVMFDYDGFVRAEAMLEAGLTHLRRLKKRVHDTLMARDQWELTRCLEVLNLYDLGELAFMAAIERKESRGGFRRIDYDYTDPLLNNKTLVGKLRDGKPFVEWK